MKATISKYLFLLLFLSVVGVLAQPTLSLEWINKYPNSAGKKIIKDSDNNIIICGQESSSSTWGSTYSNLFLKKIDTLGNTSWSEIIGFGLPQGGYGVQQLLIDSLNNIYLVGVLTVNPNTPIEVGFLIKYDSQGNFIWEKKYGAMQGFNCYFLNAAIFKNSFISLSGFIDSSGTFNKAIIAQYSLTGNLNWVHIDTNSYMTRASSIVHDNLGNAYLTFISNCCPPSTTGSIVKLDSLGNQLFQNPIIGGNYHHMLPSVIGIDDSSKVFIATTTTGVGTNSGYDCALVQFDTSGTQKWFTIYRNSPVTGKDEFPKKIFFDTENCYVLGSIDSSFSYSNGFITKFSKNGTLKWEYIYSPTNQGQDGIVSGCLMNDSSIAISGTGVFSQSSWGMFAQIIDTSGVLKSNFQDPISSVIWDMERIDKNLFLIGSVSDTNELVQDSAIVCKLIFDQTTSSFHKSDYLKGGKIILYPNPVTDNLVIENLDLKSLNEKFSYSIRSPLGAILLSKNVTFPAKINLQQLSPGFYIISICSKDFYFNHSFIKF
ncbi:MAG: T9SS type A sorting domain-containing protein [Bacteroidetes bacterium]|nr:T9SS type A sorting domain-containing protein [Bacteroidota bacterium]